MKIYSGKKDCNGKKVYVGDKVVYCWGATYINDKVVLFYKIHKIKICREEDDYGLFMLGNCYNHWKSGQVEKISDYKFRKMGIPLETNFYIDGDKWIEC